MVATDIYEIVEEHFGEPISPDLVLKVRHGSHETALDFGRQYWGCPALTDRAHNSVRLHS